MSFLLYKEYKAGYIITTRRHFSLAGNNAIYKIWQKLGAPVNKGWHISSIQLKKHFQQELNTEDNYFFVVDFHPMAKNRIGLIELLDIYGYSYSNTPDNQISYSPLMLKFRDILYLEFTENDLPIDKNSLIEIIQLPPQTKSKNFIEFLYLNGSDRNWTWGTSGNTNAVFLHEEARNYFRNYF